MGREETKRHTHDVLSRSVVLAVEILAHVRHAHPEHAFSFVEEECDVAGGAHVTNRIQGHDLGFGVGRQRPDEALDDATVLRRSLALLKRKALGGTGYYHRYLVGQHGWPNLVRSTIRLRFSRHSSTSTPLPCRITARAVHMWRPPPYRTAFHIDSCVPNCAPH